MSYIYNDHDYPTHLSLINLKAYPTSGAVIFTILVEISMYYALILPSICPVAEETFKECTILGLIDYMFMTWTVYICSTWVPQPLTLLPFILHFHKSNLKHHNNILSLFLLCLLVEEKFLIINSLSIYRKEITISDPQ